MKCFGNLRVCSQSHCLLSNMHVRKLIILRKFYLVTSTTIRRKKSVGPEVCVLLSTSFIPNIFRVNNIQRASLQMPTKTHAEFDCASKMEDYFSVSINVEFQESSPSAWALVLGHRWTGGQI